MKYALLEFSAEIRVNMAGNWTNLIAAYEAVLEAIEVECYLTNDGVMKDAYSVTWCAMVITKSEEQANYVAKLLADLADLFDASNTRTFFGIEERMIDATALTPGQP